MYIKLKTVAIAIMAMYEYFLIIDLYVLVWIRLLINSLFLIVCELISFRQLTVSLEFVSLN